jgi:putative membrane protein
VSTIAESILDRGMRATAALLAAGRLKTIACGLEHIPACGPALIVARHYHHLYDGLAMFAVLRRPFHIVVALDWVKTRRIKWCMERINRSARWPMLLRPDALALRNGNTSRLFSPDDVARFQRQALREAVDLLVQNRILVIFPEGYPNVDPTYTPKSGLDEFLPLKPGFIGVIRAAEKKLDQGIPIIPAGLHYSTGKCWVAHLRFGAPTWRNQFQRPGDLLRHVEALIKQLSTFA